VEVVEESAAELPMATERRSPCSDGESVVGREPIAFTWKGVPEPSIFPADPQKRNQAVTLAEFADEAAGRLTEDRRETSEDARSDVAELRQCLGQVGEVIARRALDSGNCHLADIGVARHLAALRAYSRARLPSRIRRPRAYAERIRSLCEAADQETPWQSDRPLRGEERIAPSP